MSFVPQFLFDPVPGTGTSLWLLIVLAAILVSLIVVVIGAISGNTRRQT